MKKLLAIKMRKYKSYNKMKFNLRRVLKRKLILAIIDTKERKRNKRDTKLKKDELIGRQKKFIYND